MTTWYLILFNTMEVLRWFALLSAMYGHHGSCIWCNGYSSGRRSVHFEVFLNTSSQVALDIDPFRISVARGADRFCESVGCAFPGQLVQDIRLVLAAQIDQNYKVLDINPLLPLVASNVIGELLLFDKENRGLLTNFDSSVELWCLSHYKTTPPCFVDKMLMEATEKIVDEFNHGLYEVALTGSYLLLKFISDVIGADNDGFYRMGTENGDMLKRLYDVFAESSRVHGQLAASIWGYTMHLTLDTNLEEEYIYRLRCLIAVPPVPPDYEQAIEWRKDMLADLKQYNADLARVAGNKVHLEDFSTYISSTPFNMCHQGLNDRDVQIELAKAYRALCPDLQHISTALTDSKAAQAPYKNSICFISRYLSDHSIGRIMFETIFFLVRHHPENDICIFYIYDQFENMETSRLDFISSAIYRLVGPSRFIAVPPILTDARRVIESYVPIPDVLIFTDIGMDLLTYHLSFSRFAAYQVVWWGHPITTGMIDDDKLSVDFFFSLDDEVESAGLEHYTEQLIRMDYINTGPFKKRSVLNKVFERQHIYKSLSLPEDAKYCLVLGRLFKLHPTFDAAVHGILSQNTNTFVVFIYERVISLNLMILNRLALVLSGSELSRIRFASFAMYSELITSASVILDTFPYGGCLTTHDALSNGIPMVTFPSEFVRGRYSLAMYKQMGHLDLVARNISDYVTLVTKLLKNDIFREQQSMLIERKFEQDIHKNAEIASHWSAFFDRLLRGNKAA